MAEPVTATPAANDRRPAHLRKAGERAAEVPQSSREQLDAATSCLILGGPVLFPVGHTLYTWALWGHVPLPRLVAIAVVALGPWLS
jgi:hypothetical protein